jgi:hypothetical protein
MRRSAPALRKHNLNMRDAPLISERTPLRRRPNALHARSLIGNRTLHIQVVEFDIQILLDAQKIRIVERRLQQLPDVRRHALLGKQQSVARLFHFAAFDQFQYQARLLWRDS